MFRELFNACVNKLCSRCSESPLEDNVKVEVINYSTPEVWGNVEHANYSPSSSRIVRSRDFGDTTRDDDRKVLGWRTCTSIIAYHEAFSIFRFKIIMLNESTCFMVRNRGTLRYGWELFHHVLDTGSNEVFLLRSVLFSHCTPNEIVSLCWEGEMNSPPLHKLCKTPLELMHVFRTNTCTQYIFPPLQMDIHAILIFPL